MTTTSATTTAAGGGGEVGRGGSGAVASGGGELGTIYLRLLEPCARSDHLMQWISPESPHQIRKQHQDMMSSIFEILISETTQHIIDLANKSCWCGGNLNLELRFFWCCKCFQVFVEPKLGMLECCVILEHGQVGSLVLLHKFL